MRRKWVDIIGLDKDEWEKGDYEVVEKNREKEGKIVRQRDGEER